MYHKISRKGGKVEQGCDVYISRAYVGSGWNLAKSKWAIPQHIALLTGQELLHAYREYIQQPPHIDCIYEIAYQSMGCWCKDSSSCHYTVLAEEVTKYLQLKNNNDDDDTAPSLIVTRIPLYVAKKRQRLTPQLTETRPIVLPQPIETHLIVSPQLTETRTIVLPQPIETHPLTETQSPESGSPDWSIESSDESSSSSNESPITVRKQWPQQQPRELTSLDTEMHKLPDIVRLRNGPIIMYEYWNKYPFSIPLEQSTGVPPPDKTVQLDNGNTICYKPLRPFLQAAVAVAPSMYTDVMKVLPQTTKGFSTTITRPGNDWLPFVCRLVKITKNKKTNRFMWILSDNPSATAANENSIKVQVATQLSPLIQSFQKDDLVRIIDYAVTQLGSRRNVVVVCHAKKLVVAA